MKAVVVIRVPNVADVLDRLRDHYEAEKHTDRSIEVPLDLERGDYAQETTSGKVYLSQDAFGTCVEGEIAEVSDGERPK